MQREDLTFGATGARRAAWLYRPDPPGPAPCVVMAHGFSGVREQRLDAFAERFAAAGMAVLLFDYRNFGASEGEPRQLVDVPSQLEDWRAAIACARGSAAVDPQRIALFGSSFSGGHVIQTAADDGAIAAVIAQCPFIDGVRQLTFFPARHVVRLTVAGLRDELRALRGAPPYMIGSVGPPGSLAAMTSPDAEPGFTALNPPDSTWRNEVAARIAVRLTRYRPGRRAKDLNCPLLVCVCDQDQVTPPKLATEAGEAAPHGEVRHYPIGHFDIYVGEAFERVVADQTAFLTRALGLSAAADQPAALDQPSTVA
jgi:fermentation-respiration switch protein FrsA (DUF1100 family)